MKINQMIQQRYTFNIWAVSAHLTLTGYARVVRVSAFKFNTFMNIIYLQYKARQVSLLL